MNNQNFCVPFETNGIYYLKFSTNEYLEIYDIWYNKTDIVKVHSKSSIQNGKPYYFIYFKDLPNLIKIFARRLNAVSVCEPKEPNICYLNRLTYVITTNKSIPLGHEIHHINDNSLDNRPDNLACMSKAEHQAHHNSKNPFKDRFYTLSDFKIAKRQKPHYKSKESNIIELIKQGKSNRFIIKTLKVHNNTIKKIRANLEKLTCETLEKVKNKIIDSRAFQALVRFDKLAQKIFKQGMYKPLLHVFNTS